MAKKLPSTAVGRRRLLKLAKLLVADARRKRGIKFDLGVIAVRSEAMKHRDWEKNFKPGDVPAIDCGTTACAWGLATLSGAFKREGLRYAIYEDGGLSPIYHGKSDMRAAERFFTLSDDESDWLFMPSSYPEGSTKGAKGERAVAKRIRDFVAGKAAP